MTTRQAKSVVHLLSPSPRASRQCRAILAELFGWKLIGHENAPRTAGSSWNEVFGAKETATTLLTPKWDSIGLECPSSGTMIHWISVQSILSTSSSQSSKHEILGITQGETLDDSMDEFADAVLSRQSFFNILMRSLIGQTLPNSIFLGGRNAGPIVTFSEGDSDRRGGGVDDEESSVEECFRPNTLKEIAMPLYLASPHSNLNLVDQLSRSHLHRPVSGLYQYSSGLCLRPLPAAPEDRTLSPPSFVFQCNSVENYENSLSSNESFHVSRVGRTGAQAGQLIVRPVKKSLGFDIRLCETMSHASSFAEAQESLMAGSLPELQSTHVLKGANGSVDPRTNSMDCWVEFRANMKNPWGFFSKRNQVTHISKAPDLPYE